MKTDEELKALANPIVEIYNNIEHDLLLKITEFLTNNEEVTIKNSLDWYFTKLEEIGSLNNESIRILSKYTNISENEIKKALKEAGFGSITKDRLNLLNKKGTTNISWEELLNSKIINNAINTSFTDTQELFKMINTKVLESTKKTYMDALNQARLEIGTGIYDYNTAITRAIEKMVDNGISGATYQRKDGTTYNMSLESVVRRDMLTAIYQSFNMGSEVNSKVMGAEYYEVSSHLGARLGDGKNPISNHFAWQGKIYKINGSDDEYDNFYEKTGYGDILGLSGVNCRHKFWAFFPEIDTPSQQEYNEEENRKKVELQNKQRAYERKIRKMKTNQDIFKQLGGVENYQKWKKKEQEFMPRYNKFLKDNDLHRDYVRERVIEQQKIFSDNLIEKDFKGLNKDIEHLTIYDANTTNKMYQVTGSSNNVGDLRTIKLFSISPPNSLIAVHNHPSNTSFSMKDIITFNRFKSIDSIVVKTEKYFYYLEKNGISKIKTHYLRNYCQQIRNDYFKKYGKNITSIHLANKKISEKVGWNYGRIKRQRKD